MRRAVRLLRLPAAERRRTVEAAATLVLVCALLKTLPFARALRVLGLRASDGAPPQGITSDASATQEVARAVARASRNLPFKAVCLPQAAAAALMLRRRGLAAEVHIGVAKRTGMVRAHAWSRCGDVTVSGGGAAPQYSLITVYRA